MIYYTCRKSRMEQETQLLIVYIYTYLDFYQMSNNMAWVNQSELSLGIYSLEYDHILNWNCKEGGIFIKYCVASEAVKLSTCYHRVFSYSTRTSFWSKWGFFHFEMLVHHRESNLDWSQIFGIKYSPIWIYFFLLLLVPKFVIFFS